MLKLLYPDKYQLWNDLVHGSNDRLFVASDEALKSGTQVPVEVSVGDQSLPVVVQGTVVGRRPKSRLFEQGVFLQITQKELEKFRKYLGLEPADAMLEAQRRGLRVHHAIGVKFVTPEWDGACTTQNVSDSLLFISNPPPLEAGQSVRVELHLDDGPLGLDAEVAWIDTEQKAAGLHLTTTSEAALERLRAAIVAILEAAQRGDRPQPILVADDDDDIRRLVTTALTKKGYEVFHSQSGDETLRMVRELHPALVIMDILMPGIDGAEICKAMRADSSLADIPVIFVSALGPDVLHQVADSAGASDYLSKPMRLADLLSVVDHYLPHGS